MLVIWGFAITAFLACLPIYVRHARAEHLYHGAPPTPIFPITATCVVVIFVVILLVSRSHGQQAVLMSAAIGAAAAPMIFEFPFDLIVMTRTYPPLPPDPALHRVLFFAPLFLVEFTEAMDACVEANTLHSTGMHAGLALTAAARRSGRATPAQSPATGAPAALQAPP